VLGLQAQLKEILAHLENLEEERDLYFAEVHFLSFSNAVGILTHLMFVSQLCDIGISVAAAAVVVTATAAAATTTTQQCHAHSRRYKRLENNKCGVSAPQPLV